MLRLSALASAFALIPLLMRSGAAAAPDFPPQHANIPVIVQPDAPSLSFRGEIRGGADPLQRPSGLAVAADGTLYVIDAARDHIRVFDAGGNPIATWGESGTGTGQFLFRSPDGSFAWGDLAIGPDGSIYVLDPGNSRIQKLTADGVFLLTWGELGSDEGEFLHPNGMGIDGAGRIYVADWGNHRVQVFDGGGRFVESWDRSPGRSAPLAGPADVAIDAAGTIWVTDSILHRVVGFNPDGLFETIVTSFGHIGGGPGAMRGPWGVTLDAVGNLYVAEYDNDRIQVFAPNGTSLAIVGGPGTDAGQFSAPSFVAVAPDGSLFVADEGNHRVQTFVELSSAAATS